MDNHNHARQHELALEEEWVVNDGWFRLNTTLLGIVVVDMWKACRASLASNNKLSKLTILEFADRLAKALVNNKEEGHDAEDDEEEDGDDGEGGGGGGGGGGGAAASSHTFMHHPTQAISQSALGKRKTPGGPVQFQTQQRCVWCARVTQDDHKTSFYCKECDVSLCRGGKRRCWELHVEHGVPPKKEWELKSLTSYWEQNE